jgi:hypothetical protein
VLRREDCLTWLSDGPVTELGEPPEEPPEERHRGSAFRLRGRLLEEVRRRRTAGLLVEGRRQDVDDTRFPITGGHSRLSKPHNYIRETRSLSAKRTTKKRKSRKERESEVRPTRDRHHYWRERGPPRCQGPAQAHQPPSAQLLSHLLFW